MPQKPSPLKWVILGCGILTGLCVLGFAGCVILAGILGKRLPDADKVSQNRQSTPSGADIESVEASALAKQYKANEVAADGKYKGRVLRVSGRVVDIKKDILDQPYVLLKGVGTIEGVQCFFSKKQEKELSNLEKGTQITVSGKCDGLLLNVLLKNCALVRD